MGTSVWWGGSYSTEEQVVGTWIDGKPIYQKTINCGTLPNNNVISINHNISNFQHLIHVWGYAQRTSDSLCIPLPDAVAGNSDVGIRVTPTIIRIETSIDRSAFTISYVTI